MAEQLDEWSGASWSKRNVRPTFEATPELPGSFPIEAQELGAISHTEIYELPSPAVDKKKDGLSNLTSPFQDTPLEYIKARQEEELGFVLLPQKDNGDLVVDKKISTGPATRPKRDEASSVLDTGLSAKPNVKDSSNLKHRKGLKTATTSSSNDIVIAVFGTTGSGKSNFISKLTKRDVKVGHGLQSCTSEIEEVKCRIGPHNVTLVDTPGFDDTNRTDTEILILIASWMKDAYDDKTRLTGVIYLHRISDNRMNGSSYKNLKMFRSLCGTRNLSHVVLATTMWDKISAEEGGARETELLAEDEWWGQMKSNGSMVRRYDNTTAGAVAMVDELVQMSPVVLTIQNEMAVQKKKLVETLAGRSIDAYLKDLSKLQKEDLAEINTDLDQAIKDKNDALQKELEAMKKKLADQITATNESKRELRRPINRRAWWQWSWRCTKCRAKLTKSRSDPAEADCPGCGQSATFV